MPRRLGQHFLTNTAVAERIAEAVPATATDLLLEIGGGRGALTSHLVGRAQRLVVVELDPPHAATLQTRYGSQAEILQQDVLELDLATLDPDTRWLVAGNLPYYVTSPILIWLCRQWRQVREAVVMVQYEVAERLAAGAGESEYGRLSIAVQYVAEVELLFAVEPDSFRPPPKVRSAVVRLTFRDRPAVDVPDEAHFFQVVEHGFRWRRKTLGTVLRRSLSIDTATATAVLDEAGVDAQRRAETLAMPEFAALAAAITRRGLAWTE
jgi:16S rRNA (adenine1518-N6/adenine1519-N6)-dimethyltransferase